MENLLTIANIVVIIYALYYIATKDKREKRHLRFDTMLLNLECIIDRWPVNKTSKLKIDSYFEDIRKLRFGNVEKVTVLWNQYQIKYSEIK